MSAFALDLFSQPERPQRPAREPGSSPAPASAAVTFATPDDMKRRRYVQAIFTCLSARREPLSIGPTTPQAALARVLDEIERHPRKVSIACNPATPEDIEIRDEAKRDAPRLLLAIVHAGLSHAEAQTALVALQSTSSPKGRK